MSPPMTVIQALDRAAKLYPNAKISGEQLDIYAEELEDLPAESVVRAIRECCRTGTFFPSLSEIRNRVIAIVADGVLVDPESAWGEVMREVRRVGANPLPVFGKNPRTGEYESMPAPEPTFSSPMIAKAVESIGWKDICLTETDQLGTLRAQFRESLKAIQRREVDRVQSGRDSDTDALTAGGDEPAATGSGARLRAIDDGRVA